MVGVGRWRYMELVASTMSRDNSYRGIDTFYVALEDVARTSQR
jgi:hypothetical protein